MANVFQRGTRQFQATVRVTGFPRQTRTFSSKSEASYWAKGVEAEMKSGSFIDKRDSRLTTLGELIERYGEKVTPTKRGAIPEKSRIKRFLAHPCALLRLSQLNSAVFADYRDERLDEGAADKTVRQELLLFSAILNHAKREWSIPIENWVQNIKKPSPGEHRERRLDPEEEAKLRAACKQSPVPGLYVAFILALETGMRRGEIAGMRWGDIDLKKKVITLHRTKNNQRRGVPLSTAAEEVLLSLPRGASTDKVLSFYDSNGIGAAFARACKRAEIVDFRFHDLRHEAASRFAPHMPSTTLAKLMGWKSIQMAMRYYNPTDSELVRLVRSLEN